MHQHPRSRTAASLVRRTSASSTIEGSPGSLGVKTDPADKLNQIVQFNVDVEETEAIRDDLRPWRSCTIDTARPAPLIVQIYVDTDDLAQHQRLVTGKREVSSRRLLLEQWTLQLNLPSIHDERDLPRIYKNSIPLFQSLSAYLSLLPAHKYTKASTVRRPRLRFAITTSQTISWHTEHIQKHSFDPIHSSAGSFRVHVAYETCDFQILDSETLLSSKLAPTAGSAPQASAMGPRNQPPGQAYGSLSTFHGLGLPRPSSPISALRDLHSPTSSVELNVRPATVRRPSISFSPFKAPSLSASPSGMADARPSSSSSIGKASPLAALAEARHPLRASPVISERRLSADPGRYSSSFGHRKGRTSLGTRPEPSPDDESNISDFIQLLEKGRHLTSFSTLSTQQTESALDRFQQMRQSHAALSESIASSILLSKGNSRASSSPSNKPPSPYTPAIPSQLSASSIVRYESPTKELVQRRKASITSNRRPPSPPAASLSTADRVVVCENPSAESDTAPNAIDIPALARSYKRSSSAAQSRRTLDDDVIFPFAVRSASFGAEEAESSPLVSAWDHYGRGHARPSSRPDESLPRRSSSSQLSFAPSRGRGSGIESRALHQRSSSSLLERGSGTESSSGHRSQHRFSFSKPISSYEDDEPLLFAFDPVSDKLWR